MFQISFSTAALPTYDHHVQYGAKRAQLGWVGIATEFSCSHLFDVMPVPQTVALVSRQNRVQHVFHFSETPMLIITYCVQQFPLSCIFKCFRTSHSGLDVVLRAGNCYAQPWGDPTGVHLLLLFATFPFFSVSHTKINCWISQGVVRL